MSDPGLLIGELGQNIGLLAALMLAYGLADQRMRRLSPAALGVGRGVLFGLFAIVAMLAPIHVADGVMLDGRKVVMVLAGPVAGPLAAGVAGAVAAAYRLYLGGAGAFAGAIALLGAAGLGAAVAWRWPALLRRHSLPRLLALGMAMTVLTLPFLALVDIPHDGFALLERVGPAMVIWQVAGTAILGMLLTFEIRRADAEQRLRDFAALSSDWVWETDHENRYTYVSPRIETVTGVPVKRFLGRRRDSVVRQGEDSPELRQHLDDIANHRPFHDFRYQAQCPTGRKHFRLSATPRFGEKGRFLGYRGVAMDETPTVEGLERARRAERQLRDAIEAVPGGFILTDSDDRIVLFNSDFVSLYDDVFDGDLERKFIGRPFEEGLRETVASGIYADTAGREEAWIAERMERRRNPSGPFLQHLADGGVLKILEHRTGDGGIVGISTDVTAEHEALAATEAAEARFRDFAETASDWFWETDAELKMTYVSERVREALGIEPGDVVGKTREMLISSEADREHAQAHLDDLRNRRAVRNFRYSFARPDGKVFHIMINGRPVFEADGSFIGYRGTGANVSAVVAAEGALRHAKEEAELANRTKSEFLANMSHELRTPLNAINGFSQVLANEVMGPIGNPKYREYAHDIRDSGEHLLSLINDVLDLSKIEAGGYALHEQTIDLPPLLLGCERLVVERARRAGLSLHRDIDPALPPIHADERAVKQMVLNLLTNAIKFTGEGGSVNLSARRGDVGDVVLAVSDTGIGIARDDIDMVLTPFAQVDNAFTRSREGTGLGLPLVKSMVEMHGGSVTIDSELGRGTVVTLRFPAWRTPDPLVEAA